MVATDNGSLTEAELRTALVNGDWSPFDPHTVRMMIRYAVTIMCLVWSSHLQNV